MRFERFKSILLVVFCFACIGVASAFEKDQDKLTVADIQRVMKQLFQQHVDKKEMTTSILKQSFKVYIDQFDPARLYLLDDEVKPYLQISDAEIAKIMGQYRKNDLSSYRQLNHVIQKSIERARNYRKEIENTPTPLFAASREHKTEHYEDWRDADLRRLFAKTPQELINRIKVDIIEFIQAERQRYGEQVMKNETQIMSLYDKDMRSTENQYLFTDDEGRPLSESEKESLFVMHVLKALASSLDAHTKFLNKSEASEMKTRLQKGFKGIGIQLQEKADGSAIITGFVPGSPAEKSGEIKVGDRIVEINGSPLAKVPFDKILDLLRDDSNPEITLTLKHTSKDSKSDVPLFHVTLKREAIAVTEGRVETTAETFGNGIIGIITLHSFYQGEGISSEQDLRAAIKKLDKKGNLRGVILDLRDNTGGFLMQAVKVAGLFISSGVIVVSKFFNGDERIYRDVDDTALFEGPLVVLTSRETASAAEIVAQALQDYGVAVIVGDDHTYGKGTIQSQTVTGGGDTFFKVTVGKYYTVSGKTPQIQGVKADLVVPSPYNFEPIGEEYLDASIKPDTISPSYVDRLTDLDPLLKPWYLRYYTPHIQEKKKFWQEMIPTLKKNSEYRISHNKNYQVVLKKSKGKTDVVDEEEKDDSQDIGNEDLQLSEAINIIKDMIMLQSKTRGSGATAIAQETEGDTRE